MYYRLNVVNLNIPLLRERKDDIIILAQYFLKNIGFKMGKASLRFDEKVVNALNNFDWLGNVRELRNVIEGALNLMTGSVVRLEYLPEYLNNSADKKEEPSLLTFAEYETRIIKQTLDYYHGNISQAAEHLNIARNTIYRKMKKYNIKN